MLLPSYFEQFLENGNEIHKQIDHQMTNQIDNQISKETIQNNQQIQQIQPTRMNIIELPREQFVSTISETPKELQSHQLNQSKQSSSKPLKTIREKSGKNGMTEIKEIQEKSIQRRIKKNITYFTQNLLIDLCREKGFFFNSIYARKNPKIFQVERIQEIFFNHRFVIEKNEMNDIGNYINNHLLQISNGKSVYIARNDETIQFILKSKLNI